MEKRERLPCLCCFDAGATGPSFARWKVKYIQTCSPILAKTVRITRTEQLASCFNLSPVTQRQWLRRVCVIPPHPRSLTPRMCEYVRRFRGVIVSAFWTARIAAP
jgi:hypothetical protein